VYAKSLIVVALCTAFVLAFALVLNYEAAGVGEQTTTLATSQSTCPASDASCERLTITSATLRTVNYTDELGTVTYSNLSVSITPSGPSPIESVDLYFGNATSTTKVYSVKGPFEAGVGGVLTVTLPSSVFAFTGKTYLVIVEGYYQDNLMVSASTQITAQ
jgi:hypothetical protein